MKFGSVGSKSFCWQTTKSQKYICLVEEINYASGDVIEQTQELNQNDSGISIGLLSFVRWIAAVILPNRLHTDIMWQFLS